MFNIIASILFFLLGCMWVRTKIYNFLIKMFLFGMAGWGGFLALIEAGYIIKT